MINDWSDVMIGPSTGTFLVLGAAVASGAMASKVPKVSLEPAPGKRVDSEGDAEMSTTPRWMRSDGRTLSEKTGTWVVSGIGNGGGDRLLNRTTMA